jgi:hypothetical protein
MTHAILALVAAALLVGAPAHAGFLDDPPAPLPGGAAGRVVYRMGPVLADSGRVDTVIRCRNAADVAATIAVEVYEDGGPRVAVVSRTDVAPGSEATFATSSDAGGEGAVVIPRATFHLQGKARVTASTARLSCAGEHVIRSPDAAAGLQTAPLGLIKKVAGSDP